jgi:GTP pyrophosphokinase
MNAVDFVEQFKLNLYTKEIYVFTPKGDIKALPKGATPLDFAFAVHSEVGMRCIAAKVNSKLVQLNYELNSGDQVEIITSINQKPKLAWLDIAKTARAKSRIKSILKEDQKVVANEGKEVLDRKLRHLKIATSEKTYNDLVSFLKLKSSFDLFYRMGIGSITNEQLRKFSSSRSSALVNFFKNRIRRGSNQPKREQEEEVSTKLDMLVFGPEEEKLNYTFANCCSPIPGDRVFGFVTIKDGIKIHKFDCPNALSMQSQYAYRILTAKWIDSTQQGFKIKILITGIDRVGLANEVTRIISGSLQININNLNIAADKGFFQGKVTVEVKNNDQLNELIKQLEKIDGIEKVTRITK